jgi:hypothetical protein
MKLITSTHDTTEGNTDSATKINQSLTHSAQKKRNILSNLRLSQKIRKRVTTV